MNRASGLQRRKEVSSKACGNPALLSRNHRRSWGQAKARLDGGEWGQGVDRDGGAGKHRSRFLLTKGSELFSNQTMNFQTSLPLHRLLPLPFPHLLTWEALPQASDPVKPIPSTRKPSQSLSPLEDNLLCPTVFWSSFSRGHGKGLLITAIASNHLILNQHKFPARELYR